MSYVYNYDVQSNQSMLSLQFEMYLTPGAPSRVAVVTFPLRGRHIAVGLVANILDSKKDIWNLNLSTNKKKSQTFFS